MIHNVKWMFDYVFMCMGVCAYSTSALHHLVDFALYVELRVFGLHAFQLDGHLLSDGDVGTWTRETKDRGQLRGDTCLPELTDHRRRLCGAVYMCR